MGYLVLRATGSPGIRELDLINKTLGPGASIADKVRPGFKYLVDSITFEPVVPVLLFLLNRSANDARSQATTKNRCDHLYEWFLYLRAAKLEFQDVRLPFIEDYRDKLNCYVSPLTRRPLSPGTVVARIGTVLDFYVFVQGRKWMPEGTIATDAIARARTTDEYPQRAAPTAASRLTARPKTTLIEFVTNAELVRLMAGLRDPHSNPDTPSRDWLISALCVTTALRISEALNLTTYQILELLPQLADGDVMRLRVIKTKGSNPRVIDVPSDIVRQLIIYIEGKRSAAVTAGLRSGAIKRDTNALFVNGLDCPPPYIGRRYQVKRAEEIFARTQIAIGMTREIEVYDPATRVSVGLRSVSAHVLHHLRHTWVIHAWHQLRSLPPEDRWIRIQQQLGHKNHQVTANTYLRAVMSSEGSARDTYSAVLKVIAESNA